MSGAWSFTINTGNPTTDQQTIESTRAAYQAQGMTVSTEPLATGGYQVTVQPAGQAQPQPAGPGSANRALGGTMVMAASEPAPTAPAAHYAPPPQPTPQVPQAAPAPQFGAPAYAMAGGGMMAASAAVAPAPAAMENQVAAAVGAPPIAADRLRYLRKVYLLLSASVAVAIIAGFVATSVGPTVPMTSPEGHPAEVPFLTSIMLGNSAIMYGAFGLLFAGTVVAGWVSKVKYLNVAALIGVAALMGIEMAPMVYVAQFYAGLGETMSTNPVRDTFMMVGAVFFAMTAYVFVTRKDFSWMGSILAMGFVVIFVGCLLTFVLGSEPFALAVATGGALLSIGMLLYVTSYIFRNSEMDDPVGDALALLVQLRNLFMFLLRIFMSRR